LQASGRRPLGERRLHAVHAAPCDGDRIYSVRRPTARRALRERGKELLLVPDETSDEMPIGAVGEFVEDVSWSATRST